MIIGDREFELEHNTYVMGILNVTPDSFSDGGCWNSMDRALKHAEDMVKEGADILDIGGESTRPGYEEVSQEEELERVIPYIERLKALGVPLSIDTRKAAVAEAAVQAGASLINDIWGFKGDSHMAEVAAKYQVPCCIMHNRRSGEGSGKGIMEDLLESLKESIDIGIRAGVKKEMLIVDPGIGFGKTLEDNLTIMGRLEALKSLGCPILLGTSRKSMIGLTLDLPVDQRLEGTLATTVIGVIKGCAFVRVHDVEPNYRAIKMTRAIYHYGKEDCL